MRLLFQSISISKSLVSLKRSRNQASHKPLSLCLTASRISQQRYTGGCSLTWLTSPREKVSSQRHSSFSPWSPRFNPMPIRGGSSTQRWRKSVGDRRRAEESFRWVSNSVRPMKTSWLKLSRLRRRSEAFTESGSYWARCKTCRSIAPGECCLKGRSLRVALAISKTRDVPSDTSSVTVSPTALSTWRPPSTRREKER